MAYHQSNGNESTLAVTRDGEHLPQQVLGGSTGDEHTLVLELVGDILDLSLDILVRNWEVAHASEYSTGLLPAILLGQETRRLLVQRHAANK